ncbi:MAG: hypothetical protein ACKO83_04220 [Roseiflexaceae bacterium]
MLALISTGWGPRCISHAGASLLNTVYRVETFGLDPDTRTLLDQLHTMCHHAPSHNEWQNDDLLAAAARALRLAQSDERAAFVTPSGPLCDAIWPVIRHAATELAIPVHVAHGLGLAESMATCLQLTTPPVSELRPTLADFVGETRMPALAIAPQLGDVAQLDALFAGQARIFTLDLFARKVHHVDIAHVPEGAPNRWFVAAQAHLQDSLDDSTDADISDTVATTADWVELFNNLTEAVSD